MARSCYWALLAWRVTPGRRCLQQNIRFVRVFLIVLGSLALRSNGKRSSMQIKSTFRISFHSCRRLQHPEMRAARSDKHLLLWMLPSCVHSQWQETSGMDVRSAEGWRMWSFYCRLMLKPQLQYVWIRIFFTSAVHCMRLCPIPRTPSDP